MSQATERPTTTPSRRALLAGAPAAAAAALAGGTVANAIAIGMAGASNGDPVFAVIERHREAMAREQLAHERFKALDNVYPHEPRPDDFFEWPIEQRCAWNEEQAARRRGSPREVAYHEWNDLSDATIGITEELVQTTPTTIAGIAAVLEYWAELMAHDGDGGDFDFLDLDCGSRFLAGVASALRNIVARGQA
jgi:hypothetical protein